MGDLTWYSPVAEFIALLGERGQRVIPRGNSHVPSRYLDLDVLARSTWDWNPFRVASCALGAVCNPDIRGCRASARRASV